jgi:hypothetical protein
MKLVNLNKHPIHYRARDGAIVELPKCTNPVSCDNKQEKIDEVDGVDVFSNSFGEVKNLPGPVKGTIYVTNLVIVQALKGSRVDVVAPDWSENGGGVRDKDGKPLYCVRWIR